MAVADELRRESGTGEGAIWFNGRSDKEFYQ
jgi:hypothetical protein